MFWDIIGSLIALCYLIGIVYLLYRIKYGRANGVPRQPDLSEQLQKRGIKNEVRL